MADDEEYRLIIDGLQCPPEYTHILTPLEFEELVLAFREHDPERTGLIPVEAFKDVCRSLDYTLSKDVVEKMFVEVDGDGGIEVDEDGLVDMDELCRIAVMAKTCPQGRVMHISEKLLDLHTTPFVELHREAGKRNLRPKFACLDIRDTSDVGLAVHVSELIITGLWEEIVDGRVVKTWKAKRYQGIGHTFRQAKYAAAAAGLLTLNKAVPPGAAYAPGEIPVEWAEWTDENLLRGVDPLTLLNVLKNKSFQPNLNVGLLHKIVAWIFFDEFLVRHPEFKTNHLVGHVGEDTLEEEIKRGVPGEATENTTLPPYFRLWVKSVLNRGVDGEVVAKMLEERGMPLMADYPLYAQQLRSGALSDRSKFLDFWMACEEGYEEVVRVFLESGMSTDEANVSRKTGEVMMPFAMATAQGHIGLMKLLLEDRYAASEWPHGWQINHPDTKGRTPLHHAAMRGKTIACEFLLSKGAYLYAVDFHGNNPLHLAAAANHHEALFVLADTGLNNCRTVCADVIPLVKGKSFMQLAEETYYNMQKKLLKDNETRRFEKAWLGRGAKAFYNALDPHVRKMLPPPTTNPFIFDDTLTRFDPRPETGVYRAMRSKRAGQFAIKKFVPTIDLPRDFAYLLKVVVKAFVLETNNRLRRTVLHVACDANRIRSHEEIIVTLVDHYGVNVMLIDLHGKKPIDLLIANQPFGESPSATNDREIILMDRRDSTLQALSDEARAEQRRQDILRRESTLKECTWRAHKLGHEGWIATREASILWVPGVAGDYTKTKKFAGEWYRFIDPDTFSVFWYRKLRYGEPEAKDYPINYSWTLPEPAKMAYHRHMALNYQRFLMSKHLRWTGYGKWQMMRCTRTNILFYYNEDKDRVRFTCPREGQWDLVMKRATKLRKLGYSEEFEEFRDRDDNLFYHNRLTGECFWDRPFDAVEVNRKETYCTDYFEPGKRFAQMWYTCDQCNSAWEEYPHENEADRKSARLKKICAVCILRCHRYHKGTRMVHSSVVQCECHKVSMALYCEPCVGMEKNPAQIELQRQAGLAAVELLRHEAQNKQCPPAFALVPPVWPDGRPKKWSGWRLCRRVPLDGTPLSKVGFIEFAPPPEDDDEDDDDTDSDASDLNSELDGKGGTVGSSLTGDRTAAADDKSLVSFGDDGDGDKRRRRKKKRKGNGDDADAGAVPPAVAGGEVAASAAAVAAPAADGATPGAAPGPALAAGTDEQALVVAGAEEASDPGKHLRSGDVSSTDSDSDEDEQAAAAAAAATAKKGDSDDEWGPYSGAPAGLPEGWIEVIDPEVPEVLEKDMRVLVSFPDGSDKRYGNIVEPIIENVLYKVILDWGKEDEAKEQEKARIKKLKKKIIRRAARKAEKVAIAAGKRFRKKDFEYESEEESVDPDEGMVNVPKERLEIITRPTFLCNVKQGLCAWTVEQAVTNPFPTAHLTLTGVEWETMYSSSVQRCSLDNVGLQVEEMHHILTDIVYYVDVRQRERELAAVRLQRFYRQKRGYAQKLGHLIDPSAGYFSSLYFIEPTEEILEKQGLLAGWAYLRRRSRDVGEFLDIFDVEWDEYIDNETSEYFYWCEKGNRYSWEKPDVPEVQEEIGDEEVPLAVGQEVLYWFAGKMRPELVIITKIREDDETGERMHDIVSKRPPERRVVCVERMFLVIPQLSAEDTKMLQMERGWRHYIAAVRAQEERRKMLLKMQLIEGNIGVMQAVMRQRKPITPEEENDLLGPVNHLFRKSVKTRAQAMLEDMDEREEALRAGTMATRSTSFTIQKDSKTPAILQARVNRGKVETLDKQIEIERLNSEARAYRVATLLEKFKTESAAAMEALANDPDLKPEDMGLDEDILKFVSMAAAAGLSARSVELVMQRTAEMRVRLQIQAEKRHERHLVIEKIKKDDADRKANLEKLLSDKECLLTTPRSLIRRSIARRMHMAMRRQLDRYSICEWGCGMWLPFGRGQVEHQLHYCTKRFLVCSQGCGLKMTEEQWLKPRQTERDKRKAKRAEERGGGAEKYLKRKSPMGAAAPQFSPNNTAVRSPFRSRMLTLYGDDVEGGEFENEEDLDDEGDEEEIGLSLQQLEELRIKRSMEPPPPTVQEHHELQECPRRLVHCPLKCTEMVIFEELDRHLTEECVKRPAKPCTCRLGCDAQWGGTVGELINAEEERFQHETEECIYRQVRCQWRLPNGAMCAAVMMAKDRDKHRDQHIAGLGITQFVVAGTYMYTVPSGTRRLKVQLWGAGGGSGYFLDRKVGYGGGGAFVEAILEVNPFDVLEIVVGAGGAGGQNGVFVEDIDTAAVREEVNLRRKKEMYMTADQRAEERLKAAMADEVSVSASMHAEASITDAYGNVDAARAVAMDKHRAMALGGLPGGGDGYGGHGRWAGGGGGGYTIVSKRGVRGAQAYLVAAGGGGGGSLHGSPGGGLNGPLPGSRIQPRNGGTATVEEGGAPGDCGSVLNSKWVGQKGLQWKGGNGSEYGGGGGGGFFGGGGGGTNPGVAGGGGGGASFVYRHRVKDYLVLIGDAPTPGGIEHDPPLACGLGEWDKPGGPSGRGGMGDAKESKNGNAGAVRILKPGFY